MLPTATLVIATYLLVQLAKPALNASFLPQDKAWSNNALRALVFVIAYALVVVNTITAHRLDWTGAWGLIPAAAAVAGLAITSYHILADTAPLSAFASGISDKPLTPAPTPPPATSPPPRTAAGRYTRASSSADLNNTAPAAPTLDASAHPDPSTGTTGG